MKSNGYFSHPMSIVTDNAKGSPEKDSPVKHLQLEEGNVFLQYLRHRF